MWTETHYNCVLVFNNWYCFSLNLLCKCGNTLKSYLYYIICICFDELSYMLETRYNIVLVLTSLYSMLINFPINVETHLIKVNKEDSLTDDSIWV